jgi:hypothetical protein
VQNTQLIPNGGFYLLNDAYSYPKLENVSFIPEVDS